MAIRLLPFRDYDEHDVVNLFKSAGNKGDFINLDNKDKQSTPQGDLGVFVKVKQGYLNDPFDTDKPNDWDPIDVEAKDGQNSLLGKTDYPHIARNLYPEANLSVEPVNSTGDACLGVTLRQTVEKDELGENLLYNPIKKDELYGVLPGEAVPVLSKGLLTFSSAAIVGDPKPGDSLVPYVGGTASGVEGAIVPDGCNKIGTVLARGHRDDYTNALGGTNVFGNAGFQSGYYYVAKIDCA